VAKFRLLGKPVAKKNLINEGIKSRIILQRLHLVWKTNFISHRKHITSQLERPSGNAVQGKKIDVYCENF
jgi:hypothetical protein